MPSAKRDIDMHRAIHQAEDFRTLPRTVGQVVIQQTEFAVVNLKVFDPGEGAGRRKARAGRLADSAVAADVIGVGVGDEGVADVAGLAAERHDLVAHRRNARIDDDRIVGAAKRVDVERHAGHEVDMGGEDVVVDLHHGDSAPFFGSA